MHTAKSIAIFCRRRRWHQAACMRAVSDQSRRTDMVSATTLTTNSSAQLSRTIQSNETEVNSSIVCANHTMKFGRFWRQSDCGRLFDLTDNCQWRKCMESPQMGHVLFYCLFLCGGNGCGRLRGWLCKCKINGMTWCGANITRTRFDLLFPISLARQTYPCLCSVTGKPIQFSNSMFPHSAPHVIMPWLSGWNV